MIAERREGPVAILTLDREDKANALTRDMLLTLSEAVTRLSAEPDVRVLILTGAGRVFSAGADLDAARTGLATDPVWEELSAAVANAPILTIAALNGTAAGGSLGMVLACDLRVAVPTAKVFYPVMRLGFLPQPSDAKRLAALVGPARAKMILMAGIRMEADEARLAGLIDRIEDDALSGALELGAAAAGASRDHVGAIKALI